MTPPNAIWTAEPPSEAGWYWIKYDDGSMGPQLMNANHVGWPARTRQRSAAPIESAEQLASLRARAEAGERLYQAAKLIFVCASEPHEELGIALAKWEAVRG